MSKEKDNTANHTHDHTHDHDHSHTHDHDHHHHDIQLSHENGLHITMRRVKTTVHLV